MICQTQSGVNCPKFVSVQRVPESRLRARWVPALATEILDRVH
jgi:hypothetical protein